MAVVGLLLLDLLLGQEVEIDLGRAILLLNFPSHAASGRG